MTTTTTRDAATVAINAIRGLGMDAIQKANSGHPGTPMGVAPVAYTLWQRFLRFDDGDPNPLCDHHDILSSNVFARARALAFGKTEQEVRAGGTPGLVVPHRVNQGNHPTNVLLAEKLTPRVLDALVALYEHSVFTQGTVRGIGSFDQWGVELGKVLAATIIPELKSTTEPELGHDSSTNALIRRCRALRGKESEHGD